MSVSPDPLDTANTRVIVDQMFETIAPALHRLLSAADPAGEEWPGTLRRRDSSKGSNRGSYNPLDPQVQFRMLTETSVAADKLGHLGRAYATELRKLRDAWAHHVLIADDDLERALDTGERLMRLCDESEAAESLIDLAWRMHRGGASPSDEVQADPGAQTGPAPDAVPSSKPKPSARAAGVPSPVGKGSPSGALHERHRSGAGDEVGQSLEMPIVSDVLRQQVLPFYLVCDESYSMAGEGIDAINTALPDLHSEISTNPSVADKTRFSMIGFSDTARTILDLVDLSDVEAMPRVTALNGTSFAAAFRLLQDRIERDVAALKAEGHRVYRPVAFFLTDGNPTDTDAAWRSSFDDLKQSAMRPNMVAFGVGNSIDEAKIREIGTFAAFVSDGSLSPAGALREFATALTRSIVASGSNVQPDGAIVLQVPEQIPGFRSLEADEI